MRSYLNKEDHNREEHLLVRNMMTLMTISKTILMRNQLSTDKWITDLCDRLQWSRFIDKRHQSLLELRISHQEGQETTTTPEKEVEAEGSKLLSTVLQIRVSLLSQSQSQLLDPEWEESEATQPQGNNREREDRKLLAKVLEEYKIWWIEMTLSRSIIQALRWTKLRLLRAILTVKELLSFTENSKE